MLGNKQKHPEEVVNKQAHASGVKEKVAPLDGSDVVPAANTVATPGESKEESATALKKEEGIENVVKRAGSCFSVSSGGNQGIQLSQVIEIPVSGGLGKSAPVATERGVENLVNSAQLIQITSPSLVSGEGERAALPPVGYRVEAGAGNQTQVTAMEVLPRSDVGEPDLASPRVAVVSAEMFKARPRPRLGGFPEPNYDIGEEYCSRIFAGSDAAHSWLTRDSQVLNVIVL